MLSIFSFPVSVLLFSFTQFKVDSHISLYTRFTILPQWVNKIPKYILKMAILSFLFQKYVHTSSVYLMMILILLFHATDLLIFLLTDNICLRGLFLLPSLLFEPGQGLLPPSLPFEPGQGLLPSLHSVQDPRLLLPSPFFVAGPGLLMPVW